MYNSSNAIDKARREFLPCGMKSGAIYDRQYYRSVYLKSEHWRELRAEKLKKNPRCQRCKTRMSLDVHHVNYRGLYDVKLSDLKTLCRVCHKKEHELSDNKPNREKRRNDSLSKTSYSRKARMKELDSIHSIKKNEKLPSNVKRRTTFTDKEIASYKRELNFNNYISVHY